MVTEDILDIAIVEDNPETAAAVAKLLREETGFRLSGSFSSAASFFESISNPVDVLLLDFELQDQNAISILRRIRGSPEMARMKVLIFTAFEDEDRLIAAMESVANGFLLKDIEPSLLIHEIRGVAMGAAPITPRLASALLRRLSPPRENAEGVLSAQERRVLQLLARGLTYNEAARKLAISTSTIKNYIEQIYRKLEVRSKSGAIEKGRDLGYV